MTVAPYTFDVAGVDWSERIEQAKARGAFLALALIGTAIAWGELVVSSYAVGEFVPHPDDVGGPNWHRVSTDIRRWNRARLP